MVALSLYEITLFLAKLTLLWWSPRTFLTATWLECAVDILAFLLGLECFAHAVAYLSGGAKCLHLLSQPDPMADGDCLNYATVSLASSITNITTEVAIIVLPVLAVWGLHMSKRVITTGYLLLRGM